MSNRQLEERQEREYAAKVAAALGISVEDLDRLEWSIDESGSDGAVHGYNVNFDEGSDPAILAKIEGLVHGRWIRIGPELD
jgi:hypothetical protein